MKRKLRENVKENKSRVKYGQRKKNLLARLDLRKISRSRSLCFKYQTVEKRQIKKERRDTCLIQGLEV